MRSTVERAEKAISILEMLTEDGATPAGKLPIDHARATLDAQDNKQLQNIKAAHAKGRGPPHKSGDRGSQSDQRGGE